MWQIISFWFFALLPACVCVCVCVFVFVSPIWGGGVICDLEEVELSVIDP